MLILLKRLNFSHPPQQHEENNLVYLLYIQRYNTNSIKMPSSYSISSHEAQSVVQLEAKVTVQVSCGHSTQAGWERHRDSCLCQWSHGGEWRGTDTLWPSDQLKSQQGWSRQETQHAGSLKGSFILQNAAIIPADAIIIILTLDRNAKRIEATCNPLIGVGWEMCVGHKCLWRGDKQLTVWNVKYVEYQTNINHECVHY